MLKAKVAISEMEKRTHAVFTACMWALSHPGRVQSLAPAGRGALESIGESLLDLETSYYTVDANLSRELARTGALPLHPDTAMYQFYPTLTLSDLDSLKAAPVGTYEYPDNSATLIVGCALGTGPTRRWSGPGIKGDLPVSIGGIPNEFWALRQNALHYPLGWDVLLVAGDQLVGLPRSTVVEVL